MAKKIKSDEKAEATKVDKKTAKKEARKAAKKAEAKAAAKAAAEEAKAAQAEIEVADAELAEAAQVEADAIAEVTEIEEGAPPAKPALIQKDFGKQPYVVDVEKATLANKNFRKTIWTGEHLQMTYMSIPPGGDIGLEVHPTNDQFLRIEQGTGRVQMGPAEDELTYTRRATADFVILVPAGTWHNVTNVGSDDLKVYALYGPPDHVAGTVHRTQADAEADPHEH